MNKAKPPSENPACLGEPWCSVCGICIGILASMMETKEFGRLFDELSQQLDKQDDISSPALSINLPTSSTPLHHHNPH